MRSIILSALMLALFSPLPSRADDLTIATSADLYVSNTTAAIKLGLSGDDVTGSVWSKANNTWSEPTTIFTNAGEEFVLDESYFVAIKELKNGTIVLSQGDDLISYSPKKGFQHFSQSNNVYDVVTHGNSASLIDWCNDTDISRSLALWTEAEGIEPAVAVTTTCTDDLSYFTGQKNVLIDYYNGVAYAVRDEYAILDTIDLTSLNYANANDDFDAQGNHPDFALKQNGDIVFAFENYLYGYAFHSQAWQPLTTIEPGFTVIGAGQGEYDYSLLASGDQRKFFAFTANSDQTDYAVYRWTVGDGWILDQTYSFSSAAELIHPKLDKSPTNVEWAFWFDDTKEIELYRWSKRMGYIQRTDREIDCPGHCVFTFNVSRKNKLFLTWGNASLDSTNYAAAWVPGTETWSDTTLATKNNFRNTHITLAGQWIVEYQKDNDKFAAKRWTPDQGWGQAADINAEDIYYNQDALYFTELTDNTLTVQYYNWQTNSATTVTTIDSVSTIDDEATFIYDDYIFLVYTTVGGTDKTQAVALTEA